MNKSLPKKKQFESGQIVYFTHPLKLMTRGYGQRIFLATSKSSSVTEDKKWAAESIDPSEPGILDITLGPLSNPPQEGCGMVLNFCFEQKHGAGTWYYKVLLQERLYWIASEHLTTATDGEKHV